MTESALRRSMLATAIATFLILLGGAGYLGYEIISELHDEDDARAEQTERIVTRVVEGQTRIIKRVALANRRETKENRRQLRRLVLKLEEDLRVLLAEVGGDPEDIPPQPEPSGANNPEPEKREPEPDPEPAPDPKPKPTPTPCLARVGPICVRDPRGEL